MESCRFRSRKTSPSNWVLLAVTVSFLVLSVGIGKVEAEACVWHSDCGSDESCYDGKCVYTGEREKDDANLKLYLIIPLCVGVPFLFFVTVLIIGCFRNSSIYRNKYGMIIDATTKSTSNKDDVYSPQQNYAGQINQGYPQQLLVSYPVNNYPGASAPQTSPQFVTLSNNYSAHQNFTVESPPAYAQHNDRKDM